MRARAATAASHARPIGAIAGAGDEAKRPLVLHVVTTLDFGGVESHMAMIAEAAGQGRYAHAFCALGGGGRIEQALLRGGHDVVCLQAHVRIPSLPAFHALLGLLRGRRPSVVHTHGAEANVHGLLAAAVARVPVRIGEEIGIPGHGWLAARIFQAVYLAADAVIGVSRAVTQWLLAHGEVGRAKARTLFVPVRLPAGQGGDVGRVEGPFRTCFVGRLEPVKNLEALVDAFAALPVAGPPPELWIIGDGSQREALEARCAGLGLADRVSFLGFQHEPAPFIRQCDACIQPSLSEGFGLAMIEAMGCEVPVMSTPVGAAPELIVDGQTGWLARGFDAAALEACLLRAIDTPRARRQAMGRNARATVADQFAPADYLRRLEALYDGCQAGARR